MIPYVRRRRKIPMTHMSLIRRMSSAQGVDTSTPSSLPGEARHRWRAPRSPRRRGRVSSNDRRGSTPPYGTSISASFALVNGSFLASTPRARGVDHFWRAEAPTPRITATPGRGDRQPVQGVDHFWRPDPGSFLVSVEARGCRVAARDDQPALRPPRPERGGQSRRADQRLAREECTALGFRTSTAKWREHKTLQAPRRPS